MRGPRVVRPKGVLSTPKALSEALGWRLSVYPSRKFPRRVLDFRKDFLYNLPKIEHCRNFPPEFYDAESFFRMNKPEQRQVLVNQRLPVPRWARTRLEARELAGDAFIVRRLHHQRGEFYRISNDPGAFQEGFEYVSEVFPKTREYRIIYLFGEPVIQLRKHPGEGSQPEDAWNHTKGSYFKTVNDIENGVLRKKTSVYQDLSDFSVLKGCHIAAVDILFNSKRTPNYVICEVNACPGLQIENNIQKVVEIIKEHQNGF